MVGFLGTRADFGSDLLLVVALLLVPALITGVVLARKRRLAAHRTLMLAILTTLVLYVVAYEGNLLRLGGVDHLLRTTRMSPRTYGILAGAHIAVGVAALLLGALVVRRGRMALAAPGGAGTPVHRILAWWEVAVLLLGATTGVGIYWATFIFP